MNNRDRLRKPYLSPRLIEIMDDALQQCSSSTNDAQEQRGHLAAMRYLRKYRQWQADRKRIRTERPAEHETIMGRDTGTIEDGEDLPF